MTTTNSEKRKKKKTMLRNILEITESAQELPCEIAESNLISKMRGFGPLA